MDTYDQELKHKIDAWVREQLTTSPEWAPERYASIQRHLEGHDSSAEHDE
jgi:hypothetical protein